MPLGPILVDSVLTPARTMGGVKATTSELPARVILPLLLLSLFCGTPVARAQTPKVYKLGILTTASSPWHSNTEGFRDALAELGLVEGKTVSFDVRAARGDPTRLPELAAELVRRQGAYVVAYAFVLELGFLGGRDRLMPVPVASILTYN